MASLLLTLNHIELDAFVITFTIVPVTKLLQDYFNISLEFLLLCVLTYTWNSVLSRVIVSLQINGGRGKIEPQTF